MTAVIGNARDWGLYLKSPRGEEAPTLSFEVSRTPLCQSRWYPERPTTDRAQGTRKLPGLARARSQPGGLHTEPDAFTKETTYQTEKALSADLRAHGETHLLGPVKTPQRFCSPFTLSLCQRSQTPRLRCFKNRRLPQGHPHTQSRVCTLSQQASRQPRLQSVGNRSHGGEQRKAAQGRRGGTRSPRASAGPAGRGAWPQPQCC